MQRKTLVKLLSAVLATLFLGQVPALDWPQWRGPATNGISAETAWNPAALSAPKVTWRAKIGRGHSAVSVSGGFAYTMGENILNAGGKTSYEEVIYCLDANTGKVVWRYAYPCQLRTWPGPGGTPAVEGGFVYTLGRDGDLLCLNARNGRVIWKRNIVTDNLARLPEWQHTSSPAVFGELLLVNGSKRGIGFHKRTGKTVWTSEVTAGGLSTPILFDQGGKRLAAINGAGELNAVEAATGKLVWSYPWASYCDPLFIGQQVFLCGNGRGAGCAMLDLSAGTPRKVWESPNLRGGFITGVHINGYIYNIGTMGRAQTLVCLEAKTGTVKWQTPIAGEWGALSAANGKLLVLDGQGNLFIVEASPAKYTVASRFRVFNIPPAPGQQQQHLHTCWTAPVLANGKIYVRDTNGNVACIDVSR